MLIFKDSYTMPMWSAGITSKNYDEFRSESAGLAPEASLARSRIVSDFKHGNGEQQHHQEMTVMQKDL